MEYECKKVNLHIKSIFSLSEDFEKKHLYWHDDKNKKYVNIESECDLMAYGAENNIYIITENPWWEGWEGMPVMVRDRDNQNWRTTIFAQFDKKNSSHPFIGIDNCPYKYMRPLTSAERDAIKVRD